MHPNTNLSIVGKKYERLFITSFSHVEKTRAKFNCICDCGKLCIVDGRGIRQGKIKSCGCLMREKSSMLNKSHGLSKTRIYRIWKGMRQRCSNPNMDHAHLYHSKGIFVCKEWDTSFEIFKSWAFSNGYADGLSIDRIDNNGNYEPSNCRWATPKQQCNNNSRNRLMTYMGKTQTAQQWFDEIGLSRGNITHRIKLGWDTEKILSTPVRKLTRKTKNE